MSSTILFTNAYITVEYRSSQNLIYHTIHQPIGERIEEFKEALTLGVDALRENGLKKWLSDDRNNGPLPQDAIDWAAEVWNKQAIEAGWKYWANVVPKELAAASSLTPVIENLYELGLHMRVFTTVEEALAWLNSVE